MNELSDSLIWILCGLIALFVIGYFLVKKIKQTRTDRIGKNGEKKVAKALRSIARKNGYKVINDLYLPLYDKTTQIDHVVIGSFGILAIETKALNGAVYGTEKEKEWTHIIGEKRHKLYNPLSQNKAHVDCIQHILRKENIYKVNVDSLVVFSGKDIQLSIPKGLPIITLDLLKKYFKKPRYKADNGVDAEQVEQALLRNRVTDKALLKKHNSNVQKMAKSK